MKHPVKLATLRGEARFNDKVKGLIEYIEPQTAEYERVMGRRPPEPFPEGTVAAEQWKFRGSKTRPADLIARPGVKPLPPKVRHRKGRKPIGV